MIVSFYKVVVFVILVYNFFEFPSALVVAVNFFVVVFLFFFGVEFAPLVGYFTIFSSG
ncbi:MAG: hypothetical protein FD143_2929 [Ignavibacteria bacterium]|nr:MAG: hypothetical protein FD143_2929 [Ignavibacteria bacterium]